MPRNFLNSVRRYKRKRDHHDNDLCDYDVLVTRSGRTIRRKIIKLPCNRPILQQASIVAPNVENNKDYKRVDKTIDSISIVTQYQLGLCQPFINNNTLISCSPFIDGRFFRDMINISFDSDQLACSSNTSKTFLQNCTNDINKTGISFSLKSDSVADIVQARDFGVQCDQILYNNDGKPNKDDVNILNKDDVPFVERSVKYPVLKLNRKNPIKCITSVEDIKSLLMASKSLSSIKVYTVKPSLFRVDNVSTNSPFKVIHIKVADNQTIIARNNTSEFNNCLQSSKSLNQDGLITHQKPFITSETKTSTDKQLKSVSFDCCPVCYKKFTTMTDFSAHLMTHAKSQNKCSVCSKVFSRSWLLKGHMRTHTGERPFVCKNPNCTKAFADKSNLRSHMRIHDVTNKNFFCGNCGRAFAQKRYLHKHTQEVCRKSAK